MKLIYQGKHGEYIAGIPARDLEAHEVKQIADDWQLSLAETEGLLMKRGLYKAEKKPVESATDVAPKTEKGKTS